jgi:riboflavin biosynthesis pyrimidine reductase
MRGLICTLNRETLDLSQRMSESHLELLYEREGLPGFGLSGALATRYGGDLGFRAPCLYANFVSSLDGVVALPVEGDSGPVISQHSQLDRFVMGVLRACADAVIVGASTFRKASGHEWTAQMIYPPASDDYAALRAQLGLPARPLLVVVSHSGRLDIAQPALAEALVVTSRAGEARLKAAAPGLQILALEPEVRMHVLLAELHQRGLRHILTEGGPALFAQLVAEDVLDELFLTSSPLLFGRFPNDGRKGLGDGLDLGGKPMELLSLRRSGSHLFQRWARAR